MTIEARVRAATDKLGGTWELCTFGLIRMRDRDDEWYCPLTAICKAETGVRHQSYDAILAAYRVGIGEETTDAIISAADADTTGEFRRMLESLVEESKNEGRATDDAK